MKTETDIVSTGPDDMLPPKRTARMLSVQVATLATWRHKGLGPPYVKLGSGRTSVIRYRRRDIESYIAAHLVETSQATGSTQGGDLS